MLQVRVERHRCIGAGNCVTLAPTAFDWLPGEVFKAAVVDLDSVDEEQIRAAAFSCPTQAIVIDEVEELLPWQLREGRSVDTSHRAQRTFMFTDIVKSTNLIDAIGDEAWEALLRWHDEKLRSLFTAHHSDEIATRGDGFFVSFESPEEALACAVDIQRSLAEHRQTQGFAPQVRIGLHAATATKLGHEFSGIGVHEAARIGAMAGGNEIVASRETAGDRFPVSNPRTVELRGISEPVEVVTVDWR